MAKLTKEEAKKHIKAMDLVKSDKPLTFDEKLFVLENYQESRGGENSFAGAFFTPWELAADTSIEMQGGNVIDLCAGAGALSLACLYRHEVKNLVCVELNPEYLEVGQRVVPEATWLQGDVFEVCAMLGGGFDLAISNPPFGAIKTSNNFVGKYTGGEFDLKVVEAAGTVARRGVFILPQMSTPFKYSGNRNFEHSHSNKYSKFANQTGLEFEFNCGIDTGMYRSRWHGVSPLCEIVLVEYPL
ncbi:hypothetical protein 13VV501A_gene0032 [Vibrio phage 13VV501A]|nr:hypothetical protein 13VV501A_gene0032 [Vibrio phage 13VV501A]